MQEVEEIRVVERGCQNAYEVGGKTGRQLVPRACSRPRSEFDLALAAPVGGRALASRAINIFVHAVHVLYVSRDAESEKDVA